MKPVFHSATVSIVVSQENIGWYCTVYRPLSEEQGQWGVACRREGVGGGIFSDIISPFPRLPVKFLFKHWKKAFYLSFGTIFMPKNKIVFK